MPNLTWAMIPAFLIACVFFGFMPGLVTRQIVRLYPRGHDRRAEIVSEVYHVPIVERPAWVLSQFELALHEGIPERRRAKKAIEAVVEVNNEEVAPYVWNLPGYRVTNSDTKSLQRILAWSEQCASEDVEKVQVWLPGCKEMHPVEIPRTIFDKHFGHGCGHAVGLIN